jgi:PAS domain S-box-containing protein
METPIESAAEDITRLRGCLNDLVDVMAVPVLRTGGEPSRIVNSLLDALVGMLRLSFAFVQLNDPEGGPSIEMARVTALLDQSICAREIGEALKVSMRDAPLKWPPSARVSIGEAEFSITSAPLGLQGEIGLLVAGSQKVDFPEQSDALLLDVAANRAALALLQARLLNEQKRVSRERDQPVGQRTNELASSNQELKNSEIESRLIIDSIPGLVAVLRPTGDVELVSRQTVEYFGRTLEELRQWGTSDAVHPEDLPQVIELFRRSIASGSSYEIVQRLRRSDGVYRWFQNRGFPLRDPDGQIVRWCVLFADIDDQKRAEDALRASERNLKLIIDTIPAVAWSARTDGSADFFSQHYLDYVGLSAEQLKDWGWMAAVHPDD